MELVMGGLVTLGVALLAFWAWSFSVSARRDRQAAREQAREAQESREREAREARRFRPGEPLACLACGARFLGPMPDTGCPECHLSALVVLASEAREDELNDNNGR